MERDTTKASILADQIRSVLSGYDIEDNLIAIGMVLAGTVMDVGREDTDWAIIKLKQIVSWEMDRIQTKRAALHQMNKLGMIDTTEFYNGLK